MKTDTKYQTIFFEKKSKLLEYLRHNFFNIHTNMKKHIVKVNQKLYITNPEIGSKKGNIVFI